MQCLNSTCISTRGVEVQSKTKCVVGNFLEFRIPFSNQTWLSSANQNSPSRKLGYHQPIRILPPTNWAIISQSEFSLPQTGLSSANQNSPSHKLGYHQPIRILPPTNWTIISKSEFSLPQTGLSSVNQNSPSHKLDYHQ